jgi:hypothetical protein
VASLPEAARITLTWDQGSEMAFHDQIAPLLREGVFFAHPASPWQRGTNENTNGLLRQYFPSAPTCPSTPKPTCLPSRTGSTIGRAIQSAGARPLTPSPHRCHHEDRQRCDDHLNSPATSRQVVYEKATSRSVSI